MACTLRKRIYHRRRRIALVALFAVALQGLMGGGHALALFAAAQAAEAGNFAFLVICTPQGIVKIAPDGTPWEDDPNLPASSALDACQVCCGTACAGLTAQGASPLAMGQSAAEAPALEPRPPARQLFRPSIPGRGPPRLV